MSRLLLSRRSLFFIFWRFFRPSSNKNTEKHNTTSNTTSNTTQQNTTQHNTSNTTHQTTQHNMASSSSAGLGGAGRGGGARKMGIRKRGQSSLLATPSTRPISRFFAPLELEVAADPPSSSSSSSSSIGLSAEAQAQEAEARWGAKADQTLRRFFGFSEFRPLQRDAVVNLLSGFSFLFPQCRSVPIC